ncbi:Erv1/Alr family FAD-linked sulfhydryl oxidase [Sphingomonas nostoxanthinifaciens]|uniref:Erv1/Alr family FAD-linked sulfhydryl oxidase n=1 Tax=Sphingomonas nostoxanthinifaciens TaxID=2872652 RepID=UPI001CC1C6BF|nr:Erv1/Alr family FAD-linked sulfhydryl oxidase [Sphingomonas nostoxanthinifaciens]UAK24564.1 Erv1/Alr family FAD-linked sulfhydryl oxidase [Sphingomonas nostoxanthinifaciens]
MDFGDQLRRYFGTDDPGAIPPEALESGIERMRVDLGLETDRGRRFALWALLHMLAAAPDLDVAFKHAEDREAARNFMDLAARDDAD